MNSISETNLSDLKMDLICRTCLNESNNMKSIFTDESDDVHKMILSCSGLSIHPLDGLPTKICSACLNKVKISYEFRQQCEISHHALVKFMGTKMNGILDIEIKTEFGNETNDMKTKLDDGIELYKCSMCPNQYTMLTQLQEHFWVEHPELPQQEYNSPSVINLKMDCVEEKYNISEPNLTGLNASDKIPAYCKTKLTQVVKSDELLNQVNFNKEPAGRRPHKKRYGERRHTKSAPPKTEICEICHKAFTTPKNLQIHKTTMHRTDTEWMSTCNLSSLTFETKSSFNQHMKSQQNEFIKLHRCQCGKQFTRLPYLKRHQAMHLHVCP